MRAVVVVAVIVGLSCAADAAAGDHANLDENLPAEVVDAEPIDYFGREAQTVVRYQRNDRGVDEARVEPRIEVGFPRNGQLSVAVPLLFGEVEPDGLRGVRLEGLYDVNQETLVLPAFAIGTTLELPTGERTHGLDPSVRFVASKTLPGTWRMHRLHLNYTQFFNDEVRAGERGGGYRFAIGYSGRLTNDAVVVADVVRRQERERDVETNLVEIGVRWRFDQRTVLSLGPGFGIGDESPSVRVTGGLQVAF